MPRLADSDLYVAQNVFFGDHRGLTMIYAAVPGGHHRQRRPRRAVAGRRARRGRRPVPVPRLAEFVAVTQVLVYIGAVVVLFLFGVMLTRASMGDDESVAKRETARWPPSSVCCCSR